MSELMLTPEELAAEWRTSVGVLAKWRYLGRGPDYIKVERSVRYRRRDIDRYLAAKAHTKAS